MEYGEAIRLLKTGKLVTRSGWNGKGMFIFMRPEDVLPMDILLKAVSIPQTVKTYFFKKTEVSEVKVTAYLCMKAADDTIVNGWLASQTDMLAEDWQEFTN